MKGSISNLSTKALSALAAPRRLLADSAAARVATWPPLEYLEPVYELKLSLDALASIAAKKERWPALQKRLDKFFGGGPLSEKNYYAGLALQYANKIGYDDLDFAVQADTQNRQISMSACLQGLENMRNALASSEPDESAVVSAASAAH